MQSFRRELKEANLKWAFLTDCTIRKADFLEAELFHTTFDGSVLNGSRFVGADMFGANLNDVSARDANFQDAYM